MRLGVSYIDLLRGLLYNLVLAPAGVGAIAWSGLVSLVCWRSGCRRPCDDCGFTVPFSAKKLGVETD